jgi:hypothetical protein
LHTAIYSTGTTATLYTAYKDSYPLPHNCGDIIEVWAEDGDKILEEVSGAAFRQFYKQIQTNDRPDVYSLNGFSNRFDENKFSQNSITFTNGSNVISVGTTASDWDYGDNLKCDTATTAEYMFTVVAVDTTNNQLYLDRKFNGTTGTCTIYCNPKDETRYISFYPYPSSDEAIKLNAYLRPHKMIADTDQCIFEDDLAWLVIIDALIQDGCSKKFVTEIDMLWYEREKKHFLKSRKGGITNHGPPSRFGGLMGGRKTFRASDL